MNTYKSHRFPPDIISCAQSGSTIASASATDGVSLANLQFKQQPLTQITRDNVFPIGTCWYQLPCCRWFLLEYCHPTPTKPHIQGMTRADFCGMLCSDHARDIALILGYDGKGTIWYFVGCPGAHLCQQVTTFAVA
jgi:hypothetical protein